MNKVKEKAKEKKIWRRSYLQGGSLVPPRTIHAIAVTLWGKWSESRGQVVVILVIIIVLIVIIEGDLSSLRA